MFKGHNLVNIAAYDSLYFFSIMKFVILAIASAVCLSSCVVEYTPTPYGYGYQYTSGYIYANRYSYPRICRGPTITPVAHGFDRSPQRVNGIVFTGRDGMTYAAEY